MIDRSSVIQWLHRGLSGAPLDARRLEPTRLENDMTTHQGPANGDVVGVVDDDDDEALRPAYGSPGAVELRWPAPADVWGRSAVDALCARVRRLGVERARRVVDGGDFHIVVDAAAATGGTRALRFDEPIPRKAVLSVWRMPPDSPDDLVHPPGILFEGGGVVVVDKTGDLAVHPSARYLHNTLTGFLRRRGTPANPCHRLDRETSGVVVCARAGTDDGRAAERRWKQAFAEGRVQKEYVAVVQGVVDQEAVVDAPLALQGDRGLVRIRVVVDGAGQAARTRIVPLEVHAGRSLVRLHPMTGRQHQLRVHLAHVGHPIVGDKLYQMGDVWFDAWTRRALSDSERARLPCARQCLHAGRLSLDDDVYVAPLPDDLRAAFGR